MIAIARHTCLLALFRPTTSWPWGGSKPLSSLKHSSIVAHANNGFRFLETFQAMLEAEADALGESSLFEHATLERSGIGGSSLNPAPSLPPDSAPPPLTDRVYLKKCAKSSGHYPVSLIYLGLTLPKNKRSHETKKRTARTTISCCPCSSCLMRPLYFRDSGLISARSYRAGLPVHRQLKCPCR